jgi:hypothetical protein
MTMLGRYNLKEITVERVLSALTTRFRELPHDVTWLMGSESQNNKSKIESYKDKYSGKRCFIIANGPSLLNTNLDILENEITFGVNRIYLQFDKTSFRPTYYLAVNELILEQFSSEISNLPFPKFLNWNRRSYFNCQDPDLIFLKSKLVIKDFFQTDLSQPMVFGATVTFVALQLAYYMGFKKVILLGLDHNYKEKGIPSKTETRVDDKDQSHFHSNYFPKGYKWQLPDLMRSEIEYQLAKDKFEENGREIIDATIDGKCQVFRKIPYQSLF